MGSRMAKLDEDVNSYFRGILHAAFLVMLRSSISVRDVTAISNAALALAQDQLNVRSEQVPRLSVTVAGALHSWHHRRFFLNARGRPRALSLRRGSLSVAALIRNEDSQANVLDVISAMKRLHLIKRTRGGLFLPTSQLATIMRLDPILAEHVCHSLGRLLATVSQNTQASKEGKRLIERSAQVQDLPRRKLAEFREFANTQGELFVRTINDWLESRRVQCIRGTRRQVARAGVHVFAFSENASGCVGAQQDAR